MKRLLVLVLLISLGLNVGLAWRLRQAGPPERSAWRDHGSRTVPAPGDTQAWRERMDRRFTHLSERLGLDPEQQAAFRSHRARVEADVRDRLTTLEQARVELRNEAERQPPDPAAVSAALAAVSRAEAAMDSLVAVNLKAELELLRPDQQSRLLSMLPFERLGRHGGFRPGPGDGDGSGRGRHRGGSRRPDEGPPGE